MKRLHILFQHTKLINIALIVAATVFFALVFIGVLNAGYGSVESETSHTLDGNNLYRTVDTMYDEESEQAFYNQEDSFQQLQAYNTSLREQDTFDFYYANSQPIGILDFDGPAVFDSGYPYGEETQYWELDSGSYRLIESVQMNNTALESNRVETKSGETFHEGDYTFSTESLPVLLGNDYASYFDVGDTVIIAHFFQPMEAEVAGILEPSTTIIGSSETEYNLDRAMVLPEVLPTPAQAQALDESNEETDESIFTEITLLSGTGGMLLSEANDIDVRQGLHNAQDESGFTESTIINQDMAGVSALSRMTQQNTTLVYTVLSALLVLIGGSFFGLLLYKIKKNLDVLSMLLVYGMTKGQLIRMLLSESMFYAGIGFVVSSFIAFLFWGESLSILSIYLGVSFALGLLIFAGLAIFIRFAIQQAPLTKQIKQGGI
ncbi:hypothetical protein [Sinobaca sp. H24]|uniref:hypothetical protein n=1 Tax=Sinobaca sp. H24 TaxID=2923376 RepID=UPI00207A24A2|nr:hypothetical protein [Sinobaca sp. H24]